MAEDLPAPMLPSQSGENGAAHTTPETLTDEQAILEAARQIVDAEGARLRASGVAEDLPSGVPLPSSKFTNEEAVVSAAEAAVQDGVLKLAEGERDLARADRVALKRSGEGEMRAVTKSATLRDLDRALPAEPSEAVGREKNIDSAAASDDFAARLRKPDVKPPHGLRNL